MNAIAHAAKIYIFNLISLQMNQFLKLLALIQNVYFYFVKVHFLMDATRGYRSDRRSGSTDRTVP